MWNTQAQERLSNWYDKRTSLPIDLIILSVKQDFSINSQWAKSVIHHNQGEYSHGGITIERIQNDLNHKLVVSGNANTPLSRNGHYRIYRRWRSQLREAF
jgi:hypothetical protein